MNTAPAPVPSVPLTASPKPAAAKTRTQQRKKVPPKPKGRAIVGGPHMHDVLCGRGGTSNNHHGNSVFRSVVARNKPLYNSCPKHHKAVVARAIVDAVKRQDPPGRFIAKGADGRWYEIDNKKAIEKTSQALREKDRGNVAAGSGSSDDSADLATAMGAKRKMTKQRGAAATSKTAKRARASPAPATSPAILAAAARDPPTPPPSKWQQPRWAIGTTKPIGANGNVPDVARAAATAIAEGGGGRLAASASARSAPGVVSMPIHRPPPQASLSPPPAAAGLPPSGPPPTHEGQQLGSAKRPEAGTVPSSNLCSDPSMDTPLPLTAPVRQGPSLFNFFRGTGLLGGGAGQQSTSPPTNPGQIDGPNRQISLFTTFGRNKSLANPQGVAPPMTNLAMSASQEFRLMNDPIGLDADDVVEDILASEGLGGAESKRAMPTGMSVADATQQTAKNSLADPNTSAMPKTSIVSSPLVPLSPQSQQRSPQVPQTLALTQPPARSKVQSQPSGPSKLSPGHVSFGAPPLPTASPNRGKSLFDLLGGKNREKTKALPRLSTKTIGFLNRGRELPEEGLDDDEQMRLMSGEEDIAVMTAASSASGNDGVPEAPPPASLVSSISGLFKTVSSGRVSKPPTRTRKVAGENEAMGVTAESNAGEKGETTSPHGGLTLMPSTTLGAGISAFFEKISSTKPVDLLASFSLTLTSSGDEAAAHRVNKRNSSSLGGAKSAANRGASPVAIVNVVSEGQDRRLSLLDDDLEEPAHVARLRAGVGAHRGRDGTHTERGA